MSNILEKLRSIRQVVKPSVAVAASNEDGPRKVSDSKRDFRLAAAEAELDHYRRLLDTTNETRIRQAFVLPIVDRASALKAQTAYSQDVLLRLPVSLPTLVDIVDDIIEEMTKYGVDPLPGMVEIRSVFREVTTKSLTNRTKGKPKDTEDLSL